MGILRPSSDTSRIVLTVWPTQRDFLSKDIFVKSISESDMTYIRPC